MRVRAREARDGLAALVRKTFPAGEVSIEHEDAGLYCTVVAERGTDGSSLRRPLTRSSIPLSISVSVIGAPMAHLPPKTKSNSCPV